MTSRSAQTIGQAPADCASERRRAVCLAHGWMKDRDWTPAEFQVAAWDAWAAGESGLVNAPTGSGKTYSLLLPLLFDLQASSGAGVRLIWLIPIRALAREIHQAAMRVISSAGLNIEAGIRTGDTSEADRAQQSRKLPDLLITTPESLHLLLARKGYPALLGSLRCVVADEWHELMGTKRGVQAELAISRLRGLQPQLSVWGISATIGNLPDAMRMLLGPDREDSGVLIRSSLRKEIEVRTLLMDDVTEMPWAGHLGVRMVDKLLPVIRESSSSLVFTNTRAQCEIWYKRIIEAEPELSGLVAMHHGSLSREIRTWVEEAIADGRLKAVVCTSSLDLGVDFAPVETIIQVGGPKGVARFLQRAGRSGHRPGEKSSIWFLPTHSLELIEAAALRQAVKEQYLEDRVPMTLCFDVLVQYLVTLSLGEGFRPEIIREEVKRTLCYADMQESEWNWVLDFISRGGGALEAYDDFHRVKQTEGLWKVAGQRIARRHRFSVGTIVSDTMMAIRWKRGGLVGHIEESFIASLNTGDQFWFAGQGLQLVQVKELTAYVLPSDSSSGKIPSWQGGKLPLSSRMSDMLRRKITEAVNGNPSGDPELEHLQTILAIQQERSAVPGARDFLIETMQSAEGFHAVFFPFEGRLVHEGMASLFAWRLSRIQPASFSIAYNDYAFELLSNVPFDLELAIRDGLFSSRHLEQDLFQSINAHELSRRKFREIAAIAGLVFKGYPGQPVRDRHLQSNAGLIFTVLEEYDPHNLLIRQAVDEVLHHQLEVFRMRSALERISGDSLLLKHTTRPSPFAFPVLVDRLRERMSSESLADRIARMQMD
jgi:ATP-dependent helicase Lhr and Lhr-like helicase